MANNLIQVKRTSISGRAANTTTLPNPGELALNMTDGILYSTNGSVVFEIGANNTNTQVTGTITVGNSTVNTTVNSTTFSGTANNASYLGGTAAANYLQNTGSYTISGTRIHIANLEIRTSNLIINTSAGLMANGSIGTDGQILFSNGTTPYWNAAPSVNLNAQYVWTNTHTFNGNLVVNGALVANGSNGAADQILTSNGTKVYWKDDMSLMYAVALG
jgi:hypothetical protein